MKVESLAKRLAQAIKESNLKPVDIANKTGIDKSSLSHYLSGNYEPKNAKLLKLAEVLNVNEVWLLGHDVPKERSNDQLLDKKDAVLFTSIQSLSNNKIEEELLIKCTMLEQYNQAKILEIVNMYLRDQGDLYFEMAKDKLLDENKKE